MQYISCCNMELVFLHDNKISIWNFINNFFVRQMQIFDERCDLPQQAIISYCFCFAVRFATFLAKIDSFKKFSTDIKE